MHGRGKMLSFWVALIMSGAWASGLYAQKRTPPKPSPQATVNGPVAKIEGLTKEQFRALAPSQLVSYQGQTMTKDNFVAQRLEAWRSKVKAQESLQKLDARNAEARAKFAQKQQVELAARNAKVQAELEKVQQETKLLAASPSYAALSQEAAQLASRYASAPPAERAKLKQRATELYNQLRRIEHTGTLSPPPSSPASTVSGSPQPGPKPALITPAGTRPTSGTALSSAATSASPSAASAGQPKTQVAPLTAGGLAGLKQAGPAINLPTPPQIQNFGVFPGPIPGGQEDVGQVVLTDVPANGITVQLSSNLPSVASVPPQVQVPGSGPSAGAAVIVVNTSPVSRPTDVTLSAQVAGSSQVSTTKLTVRPPQLSIFQCSPTVISGTPIACKVWLDGPAPGASGTTASPGKVTSIGTIAQLVGSAIQIQISTNNSQVASAPGGTISVPAGATLVEFQVPTTAYPEPVDVVISASNSGSTPENASVTLTAAAIRSFGCGSGGNSSCEYVPDYIIPNIMMTFSGPTPAGFITVSSSSGAANICNGNSCGPSQGVPQQAGAKSEAVFVFADAVAVPTTVTLSATDPLSKLVKTVQVKINPPTPAGMAFYSQSGTPLTSINNVLAAGQQVITQVLMNGYAPEGGITFDVKYSASDAAGNPLPGAVSGPAQFTYGPLPQFDTPCSAVFYAPCFFTTVQPCEVNAPCKVSVTVGPATGTLYVNP